MAKVVRGRGGRTNKPGRKTKKPPVKKATKKPIKAKKPVKRTPKKEKAIKKSLPKPPKKVELPILLDPIPSTSTGRRSESPFVPRAYSTSDEEEDEHPNTGAHSYNTLNNMPAPNYDWESRFHPRYKSYEEVNISTRVSNMVEIMKETPQEDMEVPELSGDFDGDFNNRLSLSSANSNYSDDIAVSDSGIDDTGSIDNDSVLNLVADPKLFPCLIRGGPRIKKFIKIKGILSTMLLYDYEKICIQRKLPWLPSMASMDAIFNNWRNHNKTSRVPVIMDTMIQILTHHFNKNIAGGGLLFPFERKNHLEMLQRYGRTSMTKVYGGVFFIRFCELLNRALSKLDPSIMEPLFVTEVQSMANFVEEYHELHLSTHEYKDPPPDYEGTDADVM